MAPPPIVPSRHDAPSAADALLLPPWATPHSPSPEKEFAANAARTTTPRPMQSSDDRQHRTNASLYQRSANSSDVPTIEVTPNPPDSPSVVTVNIVDEPPTKEKFHQTSRIQRLAPRPLVRAASSFTESPLFALALYFVLNLTLTLYNKIVLIGFPFPYTLTALHAFCGTVGTFVLVRMDARKAAMGPKPLTAPPIDENGLPNLSTRELVVLCLFSVLYTINIVVSNASLRLVTVPFHQVVRASAPFFTIVFSALFLGRRCTKEKFLSLIPVVAGVGFATYGDYYFTAFGFFLTLFGTLLAAMKTVVTNVLLIKPSAISLPLTSPLYTQAESNRHAQMHTGSSPLRTFFSYAFNRLFPPTPSSSPTYTLKALPGKVQQTVAPLSLPKLSLSPLHLLYLLSPLAFIQTILLAHFSGELERVRWHLVAASVDHRMMGRHGKLWLLLNGIFAFVLNIVSFNANRRVGPLGMSVAANVKQVLTILCAVVIFNLTITPANALGIVLTLIGGALYATAEYKEKQRKARLG